MKKLMLFAALGLLVMAGVIVYGFAATQPGDVELLFALPWGRVSLVDLYIGFLLFIGWIAYREPTWPRIAIWSVLMLTLGNLAACLYVILAARQSGGDWRRFWLGWRAPTAA